MSTVKFRWGLLVLALTTVAFCLWLGAGINRTAPARTPQAVPVYTASAEISSIPIYLDALGAAQPWQGVVIRAQVSGRLKHVIVQEGADVKEGDPIAEIEPAPFSAMLLQAQGALERDQAQLEVARLNLRRYKELVAQDSLALTQLDTQAALVKQLGGTVLIDKGAVDAAKINLGYCYIVSPVTGRVGVRLVDAGNLVSATDSSGIVTINQMVPMAVTFSVPDADFQKLSAASEGFRSALQVQAFSQDSGASLGAGTLTVTDNHVDAATGTTQFKARFPNEDKRLWPGQFVNVRIVLDTESKAVTVPSSAVNRGPNGMFVYVIGSDRKAQVQPITLRLIQDTIAIVSKGLQGGETVVTDGQLSLRPDAAVLVQTPTLAGR